MKLIPTSIVKRSKIAVWAPGAVLASVLVAGSAVAEYKPYGAWESKSNDDNSVQIQDSFKAKHEIDNSSRVREDNDIDLRYAHKEDNDYTKTVTKTHTEDNDSSYSEDNDIDSKIDFRQDNDWAYSSSEDNDVTNTHTEDNDTDVDVDFQIATPTQTLNKYQSQKAGHEGESSAYGSARGHDVATRGGDTAVVAGNDDSRNYGVQNSNVNQMPTNYAFVGGSSMAPILQTNTSAGRDMGPKGVFAPVGNTGVDVRGNVGQQSGSAVDQRGGSTNRASDSISSGISK